MRTSLLHVVLVVATLVGAQGVDGPSAPSFRRVTAQDSEALHWSRDVSAFSSNLLVWLRPESVTNPHALEQQLRLDGLLVSFVRRLFGQHVLLFKCDKGVPSADGDFTVAHLQQMVEGIRAHKDVRDCRVDFVAPAQDATTRAGTKAAHATAARNGGSGGGDEVTPLTQLERATVAVPPHHPSHSRTPHDEL